MRYTTDVITGVNTIEERVDSNGNTFDAFIRQPANLDTQKVYTAELIARYNPTKKLYFFTAFNYVRSRIDGFDFESTLPNNTTLVTNLKAFDRNYWVFRFSSRITLPAKINWRSRFLYVGPKNLVQGETKRRTYVNTSFNKNLFKNKATIALNINDLFNTRKTQNNINYTNYNLENTIQSRERQISLNFTYRFNPQKKKRKKSRRKKIKYEEGGDI